MRKDSEISIRVTSDIKKQVEERARDRGESEAVIVREAIRMYLDNPSLGKAQRVPAVYPARLSTNLSVNEPKPRK